jgi:hypothetical protein
MFLILFYTSHPVVCCGKLRVLVWYEEGLGDEVEMLGALGVLQPLNVLVHPVLARQLVAPAHMRIRYNNYCARVSAIAHAYMIY